MAKTVTVYTTNTCAYCVMVKKWLKMKGFTYGEVNLDEHPERATELMELSGQMGVPMIVINNEGAKDNKKRLSSWVIIQLN